MNYPLRINKYIRDRGLASRREADLLVAEGLVLVNGKKVPSGYMVSATDQVEIKKIKECIYLAYYKPRGLSTQDQPGRKSVVGEWREKGIYPIGRLDKESEGLLLLTNDGRFARKVFAEYDKEYLVTTREPLRSGIVEIFQSGMQTETFGKLLPVKAKIIDKQTIQMILNEGKKHQIRVMLNDLSYTITSIKRVRIGNIEIGGLKPGQVRQLII
jgi:23S rRNA pseudouridine2604 synthase